MSSARNVVTALIFCLVFPVVALSQIGWGLPENIPGGFNPVDGSGAEYEMTAANGQKLHFAYVIVGKETVHGKMGCWLECRQPREYGRISRILKQLIVNDKKEQIIEREISQWEGGPPFESRPRNAIDVAGALEFQGWTPPSPKEVATETITIPAGIFECQHYRGKTETGALADFWTSAKVTPFGLVKMISKDSTVVLTKLLENQTSQITGEPKKSP